MSPEIARGDEDLDFRSDVFSLGIILHEMLTLDSFMKGRGIMEIKKKLLHEPYPLPRESSKTSEIPRDLEAICVKALKKNKLERYSSVTDLLSDLQKFRHGEEVSVYSYSGLEKLMRWNNKKAYWILAFFSALAGAFAYSMTGF